MSTTKILIRRDGEDSWQENNPLLNSGEFGYDITNKLLKIGDGTTRWNELRDLKVKTEDLTDDVVVDGGTFS
jgi:hypothetical protein